ncbi:MAG: hypothetical protein JNM31_07295 [Flavobacteriales bacterium]|nr:hypothetical protein [Flavobacteriales bacterium]
MSEPVQTRWATLSWLGPNEIKIDFTPGIMLDAAAIAEVIGARKRMQGDRSVGLMLIVPAETELDLAIVGMDHLKVNQATDNLVGFAVVARSSIAEVLLRLNKAYFPTPFAAEIFTCDQEARKWLGEQVAQALRPLVG